MSCYSKNKKLITFLKILFYHNRYISRSMKLKKTIQMLNNNFFSLYASLFLKHGIFLSVWLQSQKFYFYPAQQNCEGYNFFDPASTSQSVRQLVLFFWGGGVGGGAGLVNAIFLKRLQGISWNFVGIYFRTQL